MQQFEKILQHIKVESEKECKEIAVTANNECNRIRSEYSKKEQEAYWAYVNNGSLEIEKRANQLTELAATQAAKMVHATQQEMLDRVLSLTAKKLSALPSRKYTEILAKLGIEPGLKPEFLVEQFRDDLTPSVTAALFD
ncbi:MAG: V-type ATP synthase subunit E family protein [Oscillospiraceae bacterium]|nr:V-type ATP synthase subunit E family protein [Oscillospiraceae bacterium]